MRKISIHIDREASVFLLKGDTQELWRIRRAKFFLVDYLDAEFDDGSSIIVPYSTKIEHHDERTLNQIIDTLGRYKFNPEASESTKNLLEAHEEAEEQFKHFTRKANEIWHGRVDKNDFSAFVASLEHHLKNRKLYQLQLLASFHLAFAQNACNFSVPGSGKTSIVYGAYAHLRNLPKTDRKHVNKLFIVGPLSSFGPWEDEYRKCFGEEPDVQRLSGGVSREDRIRHFLSPHSAEITLISYQAIPSSLEDITSYLLRYENNVMMVLDEAHKIKNTEGGVWAQSVLSLAKYCKSRIVLTGTPVPNGYEDIYNLYNFIWPGREIIEFPLYTLRELSQNPHDERIKQLIKSVQPFFIRITKTDLKKHMGLPEINSEETISIPMGPIQKDIYSFIENSYLDYFERNLDGGNDPKTILLRARLIRLMQAATNPALLQSPIEQEDIDYEVTDDLFVDDSKLIEDILEYHNLETPPKFVAVLEKVREIIKRGEKVIIWGLFIKTIKSLQEFLFEKGIRSELLIGEIPIETDRNRNDHEQKTREGIISDFHDPDSLFQVIIANPFAVAESISLHKACHNAIYLERNFNAATFLQSKDRIHRVGLSPDDKINYYYFVSEDSIDETIHRRLIEKEEMLLRIIEGQPIPLINMDIEDDPEDDIKALIRDYVKRSSQK